MGNRVSHSEKSEGSVSLEQAQRRPRLEAGEVAGLQLVPHGVYAALSAHVYKDPADNAPLPDGWQVLVDCRTFNLDQEGYYAVAYTHKTMRHCVIAQRGTSEVLGLRAGIWMYFDEPTIQFYLAREFSRQVRAHTPMRVDGKEWIISYTGHSLGAVLAAHRAVAEKTFAVTFEPPGCKDFLAKAFDHPSQDIDAAIITYVGAPNPVNTLKPQCGYVLMIPEVLAAPPASFLLTSSSSEQTSGSGGGSGGSSNASLTVAAGAPRHAEPAVSSVAVVKTPSKRKAEDSKNSGGLSLARFGPSRFRLRPQEYIRGYVLNGVGMGVPELQQYVTKVEPMLREMLEHTQQVHSINTIVRHFAKEDEPATEKLVKRWPSHLMQFVEYHNATRALQDPDNKEPNINRAYRGMLDRLCEVTPRRRDRIPLRYLSPDSVRLVRLWNMSDAAQRVCIPLSLLDHKALNCIRIDGEELVTTVLTAFQAKQYLAMLLARPAIADVLARYMTSGEAALRSKL